MPTTIDPGHNLPNLHFSEVSQYGLSHAVSLKIDNQMHSTLWNHNGTRRAIVSTVYNVEAGGVYAATVRPGRPDKFVDVQFNHTSEGLTVGVSGYLTPAAARALRDALNDLDLNDVEEAVTV